MLSFVCTRIGEQGPIVARRGHIVIHHRCRSRLVGGAEALSGCVHMYAGRTTGDQVAIGRGRRPAGQPQTMNSPRRPAIIFVEVPAAGSRKAAGRPPPPRYPHQERKPLLPATRPPNRKPEGLKRFLDAMSRRAEIAPRNDAPRRRRSQSMAGGSELLTDLEARVWRR